MRLRIRPRSQVRAASEANANGPANDGANEPGPAPARPRAARERRPGWLARRSAVRSAARRAYARMRTGPSGLSRHAMATVALIGGLAYALSYASLYDWAGRHNFAGPANWESIAWPLTVDLASLATGITALDRALRSKGAMLAGTISASAAALMVVGNLADNSGEPGWLHPWVTAGMHAWPPVIALACWYMFVRYQRDDAIDLGEVLANEEGEPKDDPDGSQPRPGPTRTSTPRIPAVVFAIAREGGDWKAVAKRARLTEHAAKRALTAARKQLAAGSQNGSQSDTSAAPGGSAPEGPPSAATASGPPGRQAYQEVIA